LNKNYSHLDLFSGIGGMSLAARNLSTKSSFKIDTQQFVELDPFCQRVISKHFPGIPIHSDIRDFQGYQGQFDIITGGFPCQSLSIAGKQEGLENLEKSGLWFEYLRLINEIKPLGIVIENVPATENHNWLKTVLQGLDESRYNAQWRTFRASDFGYYHQRKRLFIIAYSNGYRQQKNGFTTNYFTTRLQETKQPKINCTSYSSIFRRISKTESIRISDGFSSRVDKYRIKALGNSLVPAIAEFSLKCLIEILTNNHSNKEVNHE
jgi:DNA (cytosine-5)-methyltransferase 1